MDNRLSPLRAEGVMVERPGLRPSQLMRVALFVLAAAVAFWIAYGAVPPSASANTDCGSGNFCVWPAANYGGNKVSVSCGQAAYGWNFDHDKYSLKNRCNGGFLYGWKDGGGGVNWKGCVNGGGNRADPGRFNTITPYGC